MSLEPFSPQENEQKFFRFCIEEYLKYGSVDEVYRRNGYDLPISYPAFHRLVRSWGIVKAAGPNSKLSEVVTFLTTLSRERIPLESLYKMMPPSFKVSMSTLHRILHYIKEGVTRRVGTALIITPNGEPDMILCARDVSTPRLELGRPFGSISLPMGYSKSGEDPRDSVLRVLQQEVFAREAIEKNMPDVIPQNLFPMAYVSIADVRVAVYTLMLPKSFSKAESFSSFKLEGFQFMHISELVEGGEDFRSGISEVGAMYQRWLSGEGEIPFYATSLLNRQLLAVALDYI